MGTKAVSTKAVSIYIDPATHDWATKRARTEGRSLSQFIARLLLDFSRRYVAVDSPRPSQGSVSISSAPVPATVPVMTGPLHSRDYEIPPHWVDRSGTSYAKCVARDGAQLHDLYWPPDEGS